MYAPDWLARGVSGAVRTCGWGPTAVGWAIRTTVVVILVALAFHHGGLFDRLAPSGEAERLASAPEYRVEASASGAYSREIAIPAHRSGHFLVQIDVNGIAVPFLVDTGASKVVLSLADARRIGFETDWLDYTERYRTANGTVRAAPVSLDEMRLGEMELRDVSASVNASSMDISLLGMSFLGRLDGYEVRDEEMILRW